MADFIKDPSAILDYGFDWSDWLQTGETIVTSTWSNPDSITVVTSSNLPESTVIFVSGGTAGKFYRLTNRIVTSNSPARTDERTLLIEVQDK